MKELGHLEEALSAYEKDAELNSYNLGARFSKAAILVVMGRFEEAEGLLPTEAPRTRDEWIAYHIRGMILLRSGNLDDAFEIFKTGLESNPFVKRT